LKAKIARSRQFRLLKDKRSKQMLNTSNNVSAIFHPIDLSSQCVNHAYQEQLLKPKKKKVDQGKASFVLQLRPPQSYNTKKIKLFNVYAMKMSQVHFKTITLFIFLIKD
jgi:hypothetical protein